MLTPQEIQNRKFEKALVGGYEMTMVDDFLELVCEDYGALYKENAILKSKLKVLVEKVEEYRSTEDSMRMALVTAQKMAGEIEREAKQKGEAIIAEATEMAKRCSVELRQKLAVEEARLEAAEQQTSAFSQRVLALIDGERRFLEQLDELVIKVPMPEPDPELTRKEEVPVQAEAKAVATDSESVYLAQEVGRTTGDPVTAEEPFVVDATMRFSTPAVAVPPVVVPQEGSADEVDFFKMFDQDHTEEMMEPKPVDVRADEKIEIARSISAAMGDEQEIKVDTDAFWDDEGQPTTTRPKFQFDDLQFGSNFQDGE